MNFRNLYYIFWGIFFIIAEIIARSQCLFYEKCHPLRLLFFGPYRFFTQWCLTMLSVYYVGQMLLVLLPITIFDKNNNDIINEINEKAGNDYKKYTKFMDWVDQAKRCDCQTLFVGEIPSYWHRNVQCFINTWYYVFVLYSTHVVSILDFWLVCINLLHIYITEKRLDITWLMCYEIATHAGTVLPILFEYYTFRKNEIIKLNYSHLIVMYGFCTFYVVAVMFGKRYIPHDFPFKWGFNYGWAFNHYFFPYFLICGTVSICVIWIFLYKCLRRRNIIQVKKCLTK